MADPPEIVGRQVPPLGIAPRGIPATDPLYPHLVARGKLAAPVVRAKTNNVQAANNGTMTTLQFGGEDYDTDTMHSVTTNIYRLTAQTAGIYDLVGQAEFDSNATGARLARILHGTATDIGAKQIQAANGRSTIVQVTARYAFAVGEYAQMQVRQDSGGALNISAGAWFSMHWVGPKP